MSEVSLCLRDDKSTIFLLEDAGRLNPNFCQITTFSRNIIRPEHLGKYLLLCQFSDNTQKYNDYLNNIPDAYLKSINLQLNYVAEINSEIEFNINLKILRDLSKLYMPSWSASHYLKFFNNRKTGYLLFLRVYKINEKFDISYTLKGSRSSFKIFNLYDKNDDCVSLSISGLDPLIPLNRFNYLKNKILQTLSFNNSLIAEYDTSETGIKKLSKRIEAEKLIDGAQEYSIKKSDDWLTNGFKKNVPDYFDMAQLNYKAIYNEVIHLFPGMKSIVKYIKNIKPARLGEYDFLLKDVHNQNKNVKESALRIFDMAIRSALKDSLNEYRKDGIDLEDIFQEAAIGVWTAIFKHHNGIQVGFDTYASRWVQAYISKYRANNIFFFRIPMQIKGKVDQVLTKFGEKNVYKVFEELNRKEIYSILIKEIKFNKSDAFYLSRLFLPVQSLCEFDIDEIDSNYSSNLNYDLSTIQIILKDGDFNISDIFDLLDDREKNVISLRFGFNDNKEMTLEEIGEKFGVTRERIRQIEKKALLSIVSFLYQKNQVSSKIYHYYFPNGEKKKHKKRKI